MIDFTQEQFNEIKTKGETLYKSLGEIYCPYFKEKVSFNALGLEHLRFKERGTARSARDQFMRLKLLYLAPEILNLTHTLQGIRETKRFERMRMHSRTETVLIPVIYYEFITVIKRNRTKLIVKQVHNQEKFFWSIIPFWGMDNATRTRLFHDGDPEID